MDYSYVFLILLLPALSFLVVGLLGMKMSHKVAGLIGTCSLAAVTILCYYTAIEYFLIAGREGQLYPTVTAFDMTWLRFTDLLTFHIGFRLTPISVMMLIVISTVSLMVHIYSFGYMHGEKGFQRYYAFLSLFTMSMLGLVVATNIFQMYLFWELVGVSSYLLIGFYYSTKAAVAASKKAFIVTRFADLFFLIGILIYSFYVGTFNYDLSQMNPENMEALHQNAWIIPTALFLMFIGGAGKSAMFPLHIWLPDAMEGPTPVSALIHAATMVVAGVYLVASLFPLFIEFAPQALHWIAYIAAFTAFYAAAVACCQSDIKRVLAFSTISQIGFMLVALGVCMPDPETNVVAQTSEEFADVNGLGYMAGMFHLFTHAMFKACLFLGAGCIIHAVHSNEKAYMGGLRKYMKVTHITFLICCLAIAGIFPFSGFFSKDEILVACYNFHPAMGMIMSAIAAMTAFYMFRLYYVIFWGKSYYETHQEQGAKKPHEAPVTMTTPLIVLSAITILCGWIPFGHFVSANGLSFDTHVNWTVAISSTILAICGIALATFMYKGEETPVADALARRFSTLHQAAYKRFYMDEIWQFVTHRIIFRCISTPIAWFDRHVIDGTFNFLAWSSNEAGESIRGWQSGDVRHYAAWLLAGSIALTLILLCIL